MDSQTILIAEGGKNPRGDDNNIIIIINFFRRGELPYLIRRDVPLNRMSFYGKNYATRCPFLIKIMRQGTTADKKIMRATGYRVEEHFLEFS